MVGAESKRPAPPAAPPAALHTAADALPTPVRCEGCGTPLEDGQWAVQFPHSGKGCHLSCWEDPLSPDMAAQLAALKTREKVSARVMLTVPAVDLARELETVPSFEVVELGKNLKYARRELRAARDELRELKLELADARAGRNSESAWYISACEERDRANSECDAALDERDDAVAERKTTATFSQQLQQTVKSLRVEVSDAREQTRVLMGRTVDTLNEEQLKQLRSDLDQAVQRVVCWQVAQEAVAKECPDLCCPLSLHERLLHDPVFTVDGRTYERLAISRHFEALERKKKPITSPQKDPLESSLLVPNVTLKKHIVAMVQKKATALAADDTGEGGGGGSSGGGKRRRED